MEVTLGCDEDDFLHVQLDASLLNVPEVAQVNDSGDGSWKQALQVRAHVCRIVLLIEGVLFGVPLRQLEACSPGPRASNVALVPLPPGPAPG